MKNGKVRVIIAIVAVALGAAFVWWMNCLFSGNDAVRAFFCNAGQQPVLGEAAPGEATVAVMDSAFSGRVSMLIFSVITALQFVAFIAAWLAVAGVKAGAGDTSAKLRQLDNTEIFFDIPLYVGLFGTIAGFLVLNYTPQGSRLIAYSSTLIGIIFSLFLRLILLYPYRKQLLNK